MNRTNATRADMNKNDLAIGIDMGGTTVKYGVVRGHEIKIEQQMTITLSTDHRCIDGALGAEFIGVIKSYLEEPGLMLV